METPSKQFVSNERAASRGITVLGNKSLIYQHFYIEQLIIWINNSFVAFIELMNDEPRSIIILSLEL